MDPKFKLEDAFPVSHSISHPETLSAVRVNYTPKHFPRCETDDHCYGCNSAELKPIQEDIYCKVA